MKLFLVVLALAGAALAAPSHNTKTLHDDILDLEALLPFDDIHAVIQKYADVDAEVQQIWRYLQGEQWQALIDTVRNLPEYQELKAYLVGAGLDIDGFIQRVHDFIQSIVVPEGKGKGTRTAQEMLDEIMAMIPLADLIVVLNDKLSNSPEFIEFWGVVTSENTYNMVEIIRALPEVQRLAEVLAGMGINATDILNTVYDFLGWPPSKKVRSTKTLLEDIQDLEALLPFDDIHAIIQKYADVDAEVQQIWRYLQGEQWQTLIDTVRNLPEYQELKAYLVGAGLDIDGFIQRIHDFIHSIVVPEGKGKGTRTAQEMLDEIMALIPLADLIVVLNDKLSNSPEFIEFWGVVTSENTYNMVEIIRALPEVQRLAQVLAGMGINATDILNTVYDFLGWPPSKKVRSTKTLLEDIQDLEALLPFDDIKAVIQKYADVDAEVQQIWRYLQGEQWQTLIDTVRNLPEYQELKAYLVGAGLDIDGFIQRIHDFIHSIVVPEGKGKGTRTAQEMLDEIMALIPLADLIVVLNDKLSNSPEFIEFWGVVTSENTYNMVEIIRALPEVQRLAQVLAGMGINATDILNTVYDFLGWPPSKKVRSTKTLLEDIQDLEALLPFDEIHAIIQKYADVDAEVQQIWRYLQGEQWQTLIDTVRNLPEYQELKAYLVGAGLDIDGFIQRIHDFIHSIVVPEGKGKGTRTAQEMLDEIMALIPLADLIVVLNDKLSNSPEFIEFWGVVTSENTYNMVEIIRALPEVQRLAQVLAGMGINATDILNTVYDFLGWPPSKKA